MMLGDELISPMLQKELDARVDSAGGDIETVMHELEGELSNLEAAAKEADSTSPIRQDIALVLAELKYLDQLLEEENAPANGQHPSLMNRMRHALGA